MILDLMAQQLREPEWKKREVKEAIFTRKVGTRAINWDGGCHHIPEVILKLLCHDTKSCGIFVALPNNPYPQ